MFWKEALVITHIKDQTLLNEYPGLDAVLAALGLPVAVTSLIPPTTQAPTPTTLPPQVKEAIKTNIEIVTTVGKQKAVASADTSIKKKATTKKKKNAPKEPVWMPVGTVDGSLLDVALASAPKKKAVKKKAAKAVVLDDSTPSEEEFNEMSAKSAELNEERNKKIIEFTDQADIIKFLGEYGEHSKQVLKELRDTQLAPSKGIKEIRRINRNMTHTKLTSKTTAALIQDTFTGFVFGLSKSAYKRIDRYILSTE